MRNYFCGWYFRCQSNQQTLAIIPSVHETKRSKFCTIQLITDAQSFHAKFPFSDFQKDRHQIIISGNCFGKKGVSLDIHTPDFQVTGSIRFSAFTPIKYDIMGPFRYVPFMQCRHSVYSMRHSVNGELSVNGTPYIFQDAVGYLEGDRGRSFPREYAWTQCSFPGGALMLSIADIPFGSFHFTGIIGVILLQGKEYRLATYLGAKAVEIKNKKIIVAQGEMRFTAELLEAKAQPLRAPISGTMTRTIHESVSCQAAYCLQTAGRTLFSFTAPNASFEYEYAT